MCIPDTEESERLVARMQEIVAQEKALVEREAEDEAEIVDVERVINEKEAILSKLMDTVKGFATIKAEYEKVVEGIGALETERMNLEAELESARRGNESGTSKISASQMDILRARYDRVKQELEGFKEEKRRKENAYKLMQKETRSCSALQQEIQRLKEGKVALIKQQKATAQLIQKLKKEQQALEVQNKRSDVAKTKQMNTLKSELSKKERVLSLKDKEMNRVCSKLKSCEDHISHLLKVSRQRSRQMGTARSSPDSELSGLENEELLRSKKILDEFLHERAHLNCARDLYNRRVKRLEALNRELSYESSEIAAHANRLGNSEDDDERENISRLIRVEESSIDRITHELDMQNADLEEIASRISSLEKTCGSGGFDRISKEVVSALNLNQLHVLATMLIHDKLDAVEGHREAEEALQEAQDRSADLEEKLKRMESASKKADKEFRAQLGQAEKKRCEDMWSIIRAQDGELDQAIADMVDSVGQRVAINRALDLERELELRLEQEEILKNQISELRGQLRDHELKLELLDGKVTSACSDEETSSLQALWNQLGIDDIDREQCLQQIRLASKNAMKQLLSEAHSSIIDAENQRSNTTNSICCICEAFQLDSNGYIACDDNNASLRQRNEALERSLELLKKRVGGLVTQVFEVKSRLLILAGDMQLNGNELLTELRTLLKVGSNDDPVQVAKFLKNSGIIVSEAVVGKWRDELNKVNVVRAGTTMKAVAVKSLVVGLFRELEVEIGSLAQIVPDPSVTKDALNAAVAIVEANSATNPPGSNAILEALQCIYKYLNRVKANREVSSKNLLSAMQFLSSYSDKDRQSPKPGFSYKKADLLHLFDAVSDEIAVLCASKQGLEAKMVDFVAEISQVATGIGGGAVSATELSQGAQKNSPGELFQPLTRAVELLSQESSTIDEIWLRSAIEVLSGLWKSKRPELIEVIS